MAEKTMKRIAELGQQADTPLNETQAAEFLGVAVQTLRNWRHLRKGPSYYKYGNGRVVYTLTGIRDYQSRNIVNPEAGI